VPLKEVALEGSDAEFEGDWESEEEGEAAAHGERPLGAEEADADAAADPSGLTAAALAAARQVARTKERPFPEPNFTADGRPLDELADRVARMRSREGITVQELALSKTADSVLADDEAWLGQQHGDAADPESSAFFTVGLEGMPGAGAAGEEEEGGRGGRTPALVASADDGERIIENKYISRLLGAREHEPLYYALVRKRRRLQAGGAAYAAALHRFEDVWAEWLTEVDAFAFGSAQAAAASAEAHAAAEARHSATMAQRQASMEQLQQELLASAGAGRATIAGVGAGGAGRPALSVDDVNSNIAQMFARFERETTQAAAAAAAAGKRGPAAPPAAAANEEDAAADAAAAAASPAGDDALDARNLLHASRLGAAVEAVPVPDKAIAAHDELDEQAAAKAAKK
jgi:hypothetical protein